MMRSLVRIATLNVWAQHGDWLARRTALREGFRELRPDRVALQETIHTPDYGQVAEILGPEFQFAHQTRRAVDGTGVSIASRWPLIQVHELDLHLAPRANADFPCTTLVTEVLAPEPVGPLLFVNHFPNWQLDFEFEREQQTVAAARFIDERRADRAMHVILAGDLDADPDAASIRFWCGRQSLGGFSVCYRDVWESVHPQHVRDTSTTHSPLHTPRDWPFSRIDSIFIRCDTHLGPTLEIRGCQRIFATPLDGVWASDHVGILADFGPAATSTSG